MYSSTTDPNKDQNIMAPIKRYFTCIIFLISPVTLSLYAQNKVEEPTFSINSDCGMTSCTLNQKNDIADKRISKLDNSNQFIAGLSIPKDSLAMAADEDNQSTSECKENSVIAGSYSVLAKDIIENYKYDFSETFIDILFYEDIDLARTRTI
jgi:nitrogenase subunit NifH